MRAIVCVLCFGWSLLSMASPVNERGVMHPQILSEAVGRAVQGPKPLDLAFKSKAKFRRLHPDAKKKLKSKRDERIKGQKAKRRQHAAVSDPFALSFLGGVLSHASIYG